MPMSDRNVGDTTPTRVQTEKSVPEIPSGGKPVRVKHPHRRWILIGILGMLLLVIGGSGIGYGMAIDKRISAEEEQRFVAATTQYELALVDERNGRLASARNRLEYVLIVYPQFPGADQKLVEILTLIASSSNPVAPGPEALVTVEPTKDTRAASELLQVAQTQYASQEWDNLLGTVQSLRDADPTYEAMKVDSLYYAALRNVGILQIQKGNLETGLYDFALAERIGPIDTDAEGYRIRARIFLTGDSWWGINWEKVTVYLSQLYPLVPDMIDSSGYSVRMRYAKALEYWGDQLSASGDFCGAVQKYEASAQIMNSEATTAKAGQARTECQNNPSQPTQTDGAPSETPVP